MLMTFYDTLTNNRLKIFDILMTILIQNWCAIEQKTPDLNSVVQYYS